MTAARPVDPAALPEPVARYLAAHPVRDAAAARALFAPDAVVVDDGRTYRGPAEINAWLDRTSAEFTYTTELTGALALDDTRYDVTQHLEGDFPGGQVDLHFRFTLDGGAITRLVIEP